MECRDEKDGSVGAVAGDVKYIVVIQCREKQEVKEAR